MATATEVAVDRFAPIDLDELNSYARLQTRKDRKYVVSATELNALLDELPSDVRALETAGQRWFGYRSVYFDTERFDSYRLAATRRPKRFKVRTRSYLDSDLTMVEVKTKDRRGRTVKSRRKLDTSAFDTDEDIRTFASGFAEAAPYAAELERTLTSQYRRATLVHPADGFRMTIDADLRCTDGYGWTTGLYDEFIIETKTSGAPSLADRLLWASGNRPQKISKYATGLAALHPELSSNRWNRVLSQHFTHRYAASEISLQNLALI